MPTRRALTRSPARAPPWPSKPGRGSSPSARSRGGPSPSPTWGAYGIDFFSAIVNPPESAILSVGRAAPRPAVVEGQLAVRTTMYVSLNFDHRLVDGAPAAEFLQILKSMLEHPKVMPA
ncbi:MAG: 2-oxo acid dehydrogenase subunit E2 [Nitrospinota bacterium]